MRTRRLAWLFAPALAVASVLVMNSSPAAAAAGNSMMTPITTGPSSQTITLPDSVIHITFGPEITVHSRGIAANPDSYTEQYAEVDDIGTGIFAGFEARMYGDWEYNGTYAYTVGTVQHQVIQGPTYSYWISTYIYGNGAKNPANMSWDGHGAVNFPTLNDFYLSIYFWGNGSHKVAVSGP
jgi:hypothetical protein